MYSTVLPHLGTQNLLWALVFNSGKCGDFHMQLDICMFKKHFYSGSSLASLTVNCYNTCCHTKQMKAILEVPHWATVDSLMTSISKFGWNPVQHSFYRAVNAIISKTEGNFIWTEGNLNSQTNQRQLSKLYQWYSFFAVKHNYGRFI